MKDQDSFKSLLSGQGNLEAVAQSKGAKGIVKMKNETDLSKFRPKVIQNVEIQDHVKIILPEDIEEQFKFISPPVWNTYDEAGLQLLDQDDFYMALHEMLAKLCEKYNLNEDQIELQSSIIDEKYEELFKKFQTPDLMLP